MLTEQHRRDLEKTIKQQRKELRRLQAVEQASWSMLWRFKDERYSTAAEIAQLRAELEQERELADRLALDESKPDFDDFDRGWNACLEAIRTRRNK